jgi:hypothetical protein
MISAKEIKRIDNRMTFALGYRNLYNIVVLAVGFYGGVTTPIGSMYNWIALTIAILGGKWVLERLQENVDTLAVAES